MEFGFVVALATGARNGEPTDSIAIGVDPSVNQGCEWFRRKSANFTWLYGESRSVALDPRFDPKGVNQRISRMHSVEPNRPRAETKSGAGSEMAGGLSPATESC